MSSPIFSATSLANSSDQLMAIAVRNITKSYGAVKASCDVSFSVRRGTIHAIIGENGAGKSTIMKILFGLEQPDQGSIWLEGQQVAWRSPKEAIKAGLGMVHQHFQLAEVITSLDNVILGDEPSVTRFSWLPKWLQPIDRRQAMADLGQLCPEKWGKIDFEVLSETLPVGVQQRLEILKLLYRQCKILILDEPTAVLTPQETGALILDLKTLREQGSTVLIVTHKLSEVMELADEITVMRRGQVVAQVNKKDTSKEQLAHLMVGKAINIDLDLRAEVKRELADSRGLLQEKHAPQCLLSLNGLTVLGSKPKPVLRDLHLTLNKGEIVGIAGVEGNGQSELVRLLTDPQEFFASRFKSILASHGKRSFRVTGGEAHAFGRCLESLTGRDLRNLKMSLVPEDRGRSGLILDFDLLQNIILGLENSVLFQKFGWLKAKKIRSIFAESCRYYDIRPANGLALARHLSGGNQQKLIMAREALRHPELIICSQPTRGVDIGASQFIYRQLLLAKEKGAGILLISSSLDELFALSDRLLVMYEGHIVAQYTTTATDQETVGRAMTGGGELG